MLRNVVNKIYKKSNNIIGMKFKINVGIALYFYV